MNHRSTFVISVMLFAAPMGSGKSAADERWMLVDSKVQDAHSSHVLVGRMLGYEALPAESGPSESEGSPLYPYVAEIRVAHVEKGTGITIGNIVRVGFHSKRDREALAVSLFAFSCGPYKLDPLPGDTVRVYASKKESQEFIADFPDGFFAIGDFVPRDIVRSEMDFVGGLRIAMLEAGTPIRLKLDSYVAVRDAENARRHALITWGTSSVVVVFLGITIAVAILFARRRRLKLIGLQGQPPA